MSTLLNVNRKKGLKYAFIVVLLIGIVYGFSQVIYAYITNKPIFWMTERPFAVTQVMKISIDGETSTLIDKDAGDMLYFIEDRERQTAEDLFKGMEKVGRFKIEDGYTNKYVVRDYMVYRDHDRLLLYDVEDHGSGLLVSSPLKFFVRIEGKDVSKFEKLITK